MDNRSPCMHPDARRILFIEPFFGGSHKEFALGLAAHSRHQIDLVHLPARFWKWRMRGAALYLADRLPDLAEYDGIIATTLMSLADLKALAVPNGPPILAYFHENQLTYPVAAADPRDVHFGFTDITSALASDSIRFNSRSHMEAFFSALPDFLRQMPELRPAWIVDALRKKSDVLSPGCRIPGPGAPIAALPPGPPLIVWNHRWEHDKNPGPFVDALIRARKAGRRFRVALLGERFQAAPEAFDLARKHLDDWIVQYGFADSRESYIGWLRRAAVTISTACQENFGIATVEAVRHGAWPLLPNRLSYPEILPERFHADCLYRDDTDLSDRLIRLIAGFPETVACRTDLAEAMAAHAWSERIRAFDETIDRCFAPMATGCPQHR